MSNGFSTFTPSSTSKLFYISGVSGDDTAAAAVNGGLGYYNAGDTVIGSDPTNPVGPIVPYATAQAAMAGVTGDTDNGGCDDWIMFARGETFEETDNRFNNTDLGFLQWGPASINTPQGASAGTITISGITSDRPLVVTAWGNTAEARPTLSGMPVAVYKNHIRWISIYFDERPNNRTYRFDPSGKAIDSYFEDCYFKKGIATPIASYVWDDFRFYRCQIVDGGTLFIAKYNAEGRIGGNDADYQTKFSMTECVMDRNGWLEDVNDATTWTAPDPSNGNQPDTEPAGTGVQPARDFLKRNIYAAGGAPDFFLRGNIFTRGAGGGSVQMRTGGAAERNVFLWNEHALQIGHNETYESHMHDGIVKQNLVLHDDHFRPIGGWGKGIRVTGNAKYFVVDDNIVAHFHRYGNGGGAYYLEGKNGNDKSPAYRANAAVFTNNVSYQEYGTDGFGVDGKYDEEYDDGINAYFFHNNTMSTRYLWEMYQNSNLSKVVHIGNTGDDVRAGIYVGSLGSTLSNEYHGYTADSGRLMPFRVGSTSMTFGRFQEDGYDTFSSFTGDFDGFKEQVGWTAPERDIVSYMTSVDAGYTSDIDVTVDFGVEGATQTTPQKVYDILLGGVTNEPERTAWAELTTRRFHAAVTFIRRARANHKYNWDTDYTADALNNYIREGFGKTEVTGDYGITNVSAETSSYVQTLSTLSGYTIEPIDVLAVTGDTGDTGTTGDTGDTSDELTFEEKEYEKESIFTLDPENTLSYGFTIDAEEGLPLPVVEGQIQYSQGFPINPSSPLWQQLRNQKYKILFDSLPGSGTNKELEELGFQKCYNIYSFTDPNSQTGVIDNTTVVNWMINNLGSTLPDNTYIIHHFENPYNHNILYGETGPGTDYQQNIDTLVELVEATKEQYPNTKVTVYGIPFFRQWNSFVSGVTPPLLWNAEIHEPLGYTPDTYGWGGLSEDQIEVIFSEYIERNKPIMDAIDWMHPSVYDHYDADVKNHDVSFRETEYKYRYNSVEICNRYNQILPEGEPKKEIIPAVSTVYWKQGQLEYNKKQISRYEFITDQIRGCVDNPACGGVLFWHAMDYQVNVACAPYDFDNSQQADARIAFTNDYFNGITPDWEGSSIVITNNGTVQGLPTSTYETVYAVTGIDAKPAYLAIDVEFGINLGGDGSSGITMYDRADEMASQFAGAWNPAEHDWLAINFENPSQVQITLRGGADDTGVIPVDYEFLKQPGEVGHNNTHDQVISTVQQWGEANGVTVDPAAITYQQAHAALVDATVYGATEAKSAVPEAKIIQWWKHGANLMPLSGNGWYNQPWDGEFDNTSINKSAYDPYTTIDGTSAFRVEDGVINSTRDGTQTWSGDFANYPLGSYNARAEAVSFEASANSAGIGEGADIVVFQLYGGLADRPLDEIYEAPTDNSGDATLISTNANVFVTREEKRAAMKRQSRLAWLASLKTFGLRSSIGSELACDAWLPENLWIGLATPHDDYIDTRVNPMLEPITQDEINRYGLPSAWLDLSIVPKYWCFWNNGFNFLESDAFNNNLGDLVGTRLRDNLRWRFGGENTPDPGSNAVENWTLGSSWHQHLVVKLDEFGLERCRRVKQSLDSAHLANTIKGVPAITTLEYL